LISYLYFKARLRTFLIFVHNHHLHSIRYLNKTKFNTL